MKMGKSAVLFEMTHGKNTKKASRCEAFSVAGSRVELETSGL